MKAITLNGSIRQDLGTTATRRLRKQGLIPCVIYGEKGENIYASLTTRDFNKEYFKGNIESKPINLKIDDKDYKVLAYQLEIHPVSNFPIHIDFVQLVEGRDTKVLVPVEFKNREKSPGLKKGGFLNIRKRKILLLCKPKDIPSKITVDVTKMHIGTVIKASDVTFPANTKPVNKKDFVVVTITGRGKSEEEEKKAEEEAAAEGAPVEGAPTEGGEAEKKPDNSNEEKK